MQINFENIPKELQLLNQWVVWKYEDVGGNKPTKVPYSPITGKLANVNDENTWSSFTVCRETFYKNGYDGVGFVFTINNNLTFLDLDDCNGNKVDLERQLKIFNEFDSYSEVSPSGKGLHIIIRGVVPAGRRRNHIEIYSSNRYATFTGNIYHNRPIVDKQDMLNLLWDQMGNQINVNTTINEEEKYTDEEILAQASAAANSDKFNMLFKGEWSGNYQSQSEADFALVNIISFYTQNRNQITRIFRSSELGKRKKANRKDYLEWMINKSFDRILPPVDIDGFKNALELKLNETDIKNKTSNKVRDNTPINTDQNNNQNFSIVPPPGLIGDLAQFIFQAAPRPVPEIALAAAIGLMGGICGRAYNISGSGLNQYVIMIANTGTGKESMALGIDLLINKAAITAITANNFIGPAEIASGPALIKHISKYPCFVSILGEFGIRLQAMSSPLASSHEKMLLRMLLDLYNKSGFNQIFRGSIYSDQDKNIGATQAPAFSILAESTPETFYNALNEDMIAAGLLPRFILMEYKGKVPYLNENRLIDVPDELNRQFADLISSSYTLMWNKSVVNIDTSPDAAEYLRKLQIYATDQINSTEKEIYRHLWNRAHMKVMKLSALVAVGVNKNFPLVTLDHCLWANQIIENDIRSLALKFESGDIGHDTNEGKQYNDLVKVLKEWFLRPWYELKTYSANAQYLYNEKIIPYDYISNRAAKLASFRRDRIGATNALKRCLQILVDSGKIIEITKDKKFIEKFGSNRRVFIVDSKLFGLD